MPRRPKDLKWYAVIRIADGVQLYTNTSSAQAVMAWVAGTMLGIGETRTDALMDAGRKIDALQRATRRQLAQRERSA